MTRRTPAVSAASADTAGAVAIRAESISAGYGQVPVLHEVDIEVRPGEVVALLGANGSGKTTTLMVLAGELMPTSGSVRFLGSTTRDPLHVRAKNGLRLISEDRSVLMSLTVLDNLRLALDDVEPALTLFPELRPLLKRRVGLLSGGEQQMLTLARALVSEARVLLVDELSLGLAPLIVKRLLAAVRAAADNGLAVLLVEQQIQNALAVSDRAYVLKHGRVVMQGRASDLRGRMSEIEASYLADMPTDTNVRKEVTS